MSLINMPYNCCSGNDSSRSFGGYLCSSGASSHPSNLVYSTGLCSPRTCQVGSSLYRGCQEICCEPTSCQSSYVVSSPCQTSCYRLRNLGIRSPCYLPYSGYLGFGSSSCYSLGYGSRSCYSPTYGSSDFRSLDYRVCGFPSLNYRSRFYLPSRTC
ncbi:keratin-associated protein 13-2 [Tupaia chinensis]|nr:keratin-associated protein 13-2 [Tupaia chinensis]